MTESKHVDDYSEDPRVAPALLAFLHIARAPAYIQMAFGSKPVLYAKTAKDVKYLGENDVFPNQTIPAGTLVRVTMASRMGDLGITLNLTQVNGYIARVGVEDLTDFTNKLHGDVEALVARDDFIDQRINDLEAALQTLSSTGQPVNKLWEHELTDRRREKKSLDYKARQRLIKQQKQSL